MRYIQTNIPPPKSESILNLNNDCLISIFRYLPLGDLLSISKASPQFAHILNKDICFQKTLQLGPDSIRQSSDQGIPLNELFEHVGQQIATVFINFDYMDGHQPDRVLAAIQRHCTKLKHLHLTKWLMHLNEYLPMLERLHALHLEGCRERPTILQDPSGAEVLRSLKQLKVLHMNDTLFCKTIDNNVLPLSDQNKQLRRLTLMQYTTYGFAELTNYLRAFPNLQFLTLHWKSTRSIELAPLAEMRDLRSLHLAHYEGSTIDDRFELSEMLLRLFHAFERHQRLEELVLHRCPLTDQGYVTVARIQSVRHIALRGLHVDTDRAVRRIAAHGNYRTVSLFDSSGLTDLGLLAIVRACPHLEMVDVTWCTWVTSFVLRQLCDCILQRQKSRAQTPLELLVGATCKLNTSKIDRNVLRVLFDQKLSRYYRQPKQVQTVQNEMDRAAMCNEPIRFPSISPHVQMVENRGLCIRPENPNMYINDRRELVYGPAPYRYSVIWPHMDEKRHINQLIEF